MAIRSVLLAFLFCCSTSYAEEAVEIPLSKIWGSNMPGTKELGELAKQDPRLSEVVRSLWKPVPKGDTAKPAFAVSGTELEILGEVHAVLVEGRKPHKSLPPNRDVYVVFFSYQNQPYVHLHKVERQGNIINVRWRFVPHETEETTEHFAMIPLGKLPSGEYRVNIIRSPMPQKYIDLGFRPTSDEVARRNVCKSFSFTISEQGE